MNRGIFFRLLICILFIGGCLYCCMTVQNEITALQMRIPKLVAEVRRIEEENTQLLYEIKAFTSPGNLMDLAKTAPFSHLKFPLMTDLLTLRGVDRFEAPAERTKGTIHAQSSITFAAGATP